MSSNTKTYNIDSRLNLSIKQYGHTPTFLPCSCSNKKIYHFKYHPHVWHHIVRIILLMSYHLGKNRIVHDIGSFCLGSAYWFLLKKHYSSLAFSNINRLTVLHRLKENTKVSNNSPMCLTGGSASPNDGKSLGIHFIIGGFVCHIT